MYSCPLCKKFLRRRALHLLMSLKEPTHNVMNNQRVEANTKLTISFLPTGQGRQYSNTFFLSLPKTKVSICWVLSLRLETKNIVAKGFEIYPFSTHFHWYLIIVPYLTPSFGQDWTNSHKRLIHWMDVMTQLWMSS